MLVNLAKAYQWPIVLAYALPVLLLVALGAWWIRRR
jgi:lipopolysaccharide export LptBFGC system permease protein LptF